MPKLLVFAPCEKVVISQDDGGSSLIALLQGFTATEALPQGDDLALPFNWFVFTLWENTGDSGGVQRVELVAPNKVIRVSVDMPVDVADGKRFFRAVTKVAGFPVTVPGDYSLRLSYRGAQETEFKELASFPIPLTAPENA